jgi:hypothetical protein
MANEISDKQKAEVGVLHQQWLANPITQNFLRILTGYESNLVSKAGNLVYETVPDVQFRVIAAQIQTIKTIKRYVNETESFIAGSTR